MTSTAAKRNGASAAEHVEGPKSTISLQPIEFVTYSIPIIGETPLIPHKWSEKAKGMMREKQSGSKARSVKEPKIPEVEAEAATYYLPDERPGMPASAFKAAIVNATRFYDGVTKVLSKQLFRVVGEGEDQLVAIEGPRTLREDTPRNATGVADLRYRYAYWPWRAELAVRFAPSMIDLGSVLALVNTAGLGGVGDWRPSAPKSDTGTFGCWRLDDERQVERIS